MSHFYHTVPMLRLTEHSVCYSLLRFLCKSLFISVQQFMELEPEMLATETIVPIYFAMEDDELLSIYTQTLTSSSSQGSLSAAEGRAFFLP